MAKITFAGGIPGWHFHLHAGNGAVDIEKRFSRTGTVTISGLDADFYSVGHQAWTWLDPSEVADDVMSGVAGVVLPIQMRAGDEIDIRL